MLSSRCLVPTLLHSFNWPFRKYHATQSKHYISWQYRFKTVIEINVAGYEEWMKIRHQRDHVSFQKGRKQKNSSHAFQSLRLWWIHVNKRFVCQLIVQCWAAVLIERNWRSMSFKMCSLNRRLIRTMAWSCSIPYLALGESFKDSHNTNIHAIYWIKIGN